MPENFYEFSLPVFRDPRGDLIPIELLAKIPFAVERVYFLKNVPEATTRGAHCHFIEQEVFLCLSGKCRALIDSDKQGKKEIWLDHPEKAIFVGTRVWHEFDSFSPDAVLLALSSTPYLPGAENYETDYVSFIRDV